MTEFKKLIPSLALIVLAIGGLVSAYINTSQSEEIQELKSRIYILEKDIKFTTELIIKM